MGDDDFDLIPLSLVALFEILEKEAWALMGADYLSLSVFDRVKKSRE